MAQVSIHAPWEGCDCTDAKAVTRIGKFQFTHPGKGATIGVHTEEATYIQFQFTHPGKGAT